MSQHDMDIANQTRTAFRADLNLALIALVGNSSGASEPSTKYAYQFWTDTTAGQFKIRNAANTAWITLFTISTGLMEANAALAGSVSQAFSASTLKIGNVTASAGSQVMKAGTASNTLDVDPRTDGPTGYTDGVRIGGNYSTNPIPGAAIWFGASGAGGQRGGIFLGTKDLDDNTTQPVIRMQIASDGTVSIGGTNLIPRADLSGCTLSNAGAASIYMNVSAGVATDASNAVTMTFAGLGKGTGSWAVGTGVGGLDTGSIAANTWYHFYIIKRLDTGVVDMLFSLSATAPTMPANYSYKRRIGSCKTDGSSNWTMIIQDGDRFQLDVAVLDIDVSNPGTSAATRTLASVPTGINVIALFNAMAKSESGVADGFTLFSDLAVADAAPSVTAAPLANAGASGTYVQHMYSTQMIRTNTSAQIRSRAGGSSANTALRIATTGWIDSRGKNA